MTKLEMDKFVQKVKDSKDMIDVRVAKLANASDLRSEALSGRVGSNPTSNTKE